jgi:vanillate O-demethylase ferredoxin subunit
MPEDGLGMAEAMIWAAAHLRSHRDLTADIRLFEIEPEAEFVPPAPGSHINVAVEIDGRPDVRCYSVVGGGNGRYRIAVKRLVESRGGSAHMWRLAPGARLRISSPRNHFRLEQGCEEYLLVAGGIGITPIHPMALALAEARAPFRLLYAAHSRDELAFAAELAAGIGDRLELFVGEEGRRIDLAAAIDRLANRGVLYVCGPFGMLEAARRHWQSSGRPMDGLHFETFGSGGRLATESFVVKIPRLGREIKVSKQESMLEAMERAGIEVIADCRRGECGLCALTVLQADGPIDHRDVFFSDRQKIDGTKLCACVSRLAGGSITIDTADRTA